MNELLFTNDEYVKILNELKSIDIKNQCLICKQEILFDSIELDCKHRYHFECLNSTFIKYYGKKCPYCSLDLNLSNYENKCIYVNNKSIQCKKKAYNNDKICKTHINLFIKRKNKEKLKNNKKINNQILKIQKKINNNNEKINKIKNDNKLLINEIENLKKNLL